MRPSGRKKKNEETKGHEAARTVLCPFVLKCKKSAAVESNAPHARCVIVKRSNEQGYLASELMDLRSDAGGSAVIPSTFSERGGESMVLCIFPVFRYKINHTAFSSGFRANN